jgi:Ca-activated chloride channel family protein
MLLVSLLIGTHRRGGARRPAIAGLAVTSSLMMLTILTGHRTRAAEVNAGATESAYARAAQREPKKPVLEFNKGTAAYRAGQFPQAAQSFQQSITHAPSSDLKRLADQEDAYYDLGNALYRSGQKSEQAAPQETLERWTEAVKAYETALQLRADDADSRFNRDLVKRKIEALRQNQNRGPQQGQPQGQPPNPQQNPKNSDQKPDQRQPPPPGQSPQPPTGSAGDRPPQSAGQPPSATPGGEPQPRVQPPDKRAGDDDRAADSQRRPGQMSREEARELLDSAKGDERHALGAPLAVRDADDPPEKPFKNW